MGDKGGGPIEGIGGGDGEDSSPVARAQKMQEYMEQVAAAEAQRASARDIAQQQQPAQDEGKIIRGGGGMRRGPAGGPEPDIMPGGFEQARLQDMLSREVARSEGAKGKDARLPDEAAPSTDAVGGAEGGGGGGAGGGGGGRAGGAGGKEHKRVEQLDYEQGKKILKVTDVFIDDGAAAKGGGKVGGAAKAGGGGGGGAGKAGGKGGAGGAAAAAEGTYTQFTKKIDLEPWKKGADVEKLEKKKHSIPKGVLGPDGKPIPDDPSGR